eukprot:354564-Chlamydomonas_euryale.AAC.4
MVPSGVQTGSSNGVNAIAQQWYGSDLNGARDLSLWPPHSVRHSVAVRNMRSCRESAESE